MKVFDKGGWEHTVVVDTPNALVEGAESEI